MRVVNMGGKRRQDKADRDPHKKADKQAQSIRQIRNIHNLCDDR